MIDLNKIYTSNNCGDYKITKIMSWDKVHVEFLLTGYKTVVTSGNLEKGTVKDKLYPNVYGVGYVGEGKHQASEKCKETRQYNSWNCMLQRCYDPKYHKTRPTYINCSVCKEWHNFQNFAEWFDDNYIEGFQIDKDIKQIGVEDKTYSPETCKFVSSTENSIQARAGTYTMIDPNDKVHEIYNMSAFCRGKRLTSNSMTRVCRGERNHHKGWTRA